MQIIENKSFSSERALYESNGLKLINCTFEGVEDGESALKESENIEVYDSVFRLRYPFWHDTGVLVAGCELAESARAPFWYTKKLEIKSTNINSPKALRECENITLFDTNVSSDEFGWSCKDITFRRATLKGEYFMLRSSNIDFLEVEFSGKYSFQYIKNARFENCTLNTKDAFWHAEDVYLKNCTVNGEYLGWYSKNLTLENCQISGTQPLCYCKGLKLINCQMQNTDLSFEKSEVEATLASPILSIKNPKSGKIIVPSANEIISTDKNSACQIVLTQKEEILI